MPEPLRWPIPPTESSEAGAAHDVLAAEEFPVGAAAPELQQPVEPAHDVLAAEEFGVPAADPELSERSGEAHDVLAAEEFPLGSADPVLHSTPLVLPPDPSGIAEPHDVLAAEEFALPAAPPGSRVPISAAPSPLRPALIAVAGLLGLAVLLRRRGRRR
ncbi:MAG: hypothetical protein ACYDHH_22725 [Solirubrobacteraceae bacterium]